MSGAKKQREELDKGYGKGNEAFDRAAGVLKPYADAGLGPLNQLAYLLGLGSADQSAAARKNFESSPFYAGGQEAFGTSKDTIDAGLSDQGLLFSGARQRAVETARRREYGNAFQQYLNSTTALAGIGLQGAGGEANIFGQQGGLAFDYGRARAGTHKGVLGNLLPIFGAVGQAAASSYGAQGF